MTKKMAKYNPFVPVVLSTLQDGKYVDINTSFTELFGFSSDDVIGKRAADLNMWVDPTQRESFVAILKSGKEVRHEMVKLRTKSGEELDVVFSMQAIQRASEPLVLSTGYAITSDLLRENKRLKNYKNLRSLISDFPGAIWLLDNELKLITANRNFYDGVETFTGKSISPGESIDIPGQPAERRARWKRLFVRALKGERTVDIVMVERPDGLDAFAETTMIPVYDDQGSVIGIACFSNDITHFVQPAMDFLASPIKIDVFKEVIEQSDKRKCRQALNGNTGSESLLSAKRENARIALPIGDGLVFIRIMEILYCRASGNYTEIFLQGGRKYLVSRQLQEYEKLLKEYNFFRIHHSTLVQLDSIERYVRGDGGYVIMTDGHSLMVSRRKKDEFLARIRYTDQAESNQKPNRLSVKTPPVVSIERT